jgi:hypothetical protein
MIRTLNSAASVFSQPFFLSLEIVSLTFLDALKTCKERLQPKENGSRRRKQPKSERDTKESNVEANPLHVGMLYIQSQAGKEIVSIVKGTILTLYIS